MRVAVDVSPLSHRRTGVGTYLLGHLRGLVENGAEVVAFAPLSFRVTRHVREQLRGLDLELRLPVVPLAHRWRTAWSRLGRPPAEWWLGDVDVLHFSDWSYPPQRSGVRATTIHDLVPIHHPEWTHGRTVPMHTAKYRHAAEHADVIVCISEFGARDVEQTLGVDAERIVVAYPAPGVAFTPDGERASGEYVLAVGTLEPRKNLEVVLGLEGLVVAGGEGWGERPQLERHVDDPDDEELARLYRGANVVVYPSRYEGFGIPIVEAMACGVPVVASSHPSLDEAAGDAALRADPEDPEAWRRAVAEARERRDELVARGLAHAARFTWREAGRTILDAYTRAA